MEGHAGHVRSARAAVRAEPAVSQRRRGAVHRRLGDQRGWEHEGLLRLHRRRVGLRQRSATPICTSPATRRQACSIETGRTARSRTSGCSRAPRSTRTGRSRAVWASPSPTTTRTATWTSSRPTSATTCRTCITTTATARSRIACLQSGLGGYVHYVGWGVHLADVDHDGRRDLLMINGHVYPEADQTPEIRYRQPRLLYWHVGNGRFRDLSAQAGAGISRALVVARLRDGRPRRRRLARNRRQQHGRASEPAEEHGTAPALAARAAVGVTANRDAIGARIVVHDGRPARVGRGPERVQLPLAERRSPARRLVDQRVLRPHRGDLAGWDEGAVSRGKSRSRGHADAGDRIAALVTRRDLAAAQFSLGRQTSRRGRAVRSCCHVVWQRNVEISRSRSTGPAPRRGRALARAAA